MTSDKFRIIDNGESSDKNDSLKIIGTLGADILEDRKTVISFKENYIVFNLAVIPDGFGKNLTDFTFKKRHIIIPALLKGNKEKFLYDSGTSAYELLTTKRNMGRLKVKKIQKLLQKKANSWQNVLTTYTAKTDNLIKNRKQKYTPKQCYLCRRLFADTVFYDEVFGYDRNAGESDIYE